jgi:hypothetical protein
MRRGGRTIGILLAVAVAYGAWVLTGPGPIPLTDANRQPLAETAEQGRCAGEVFWSSGGAGGAEAMAECLADETEPEVDWPAVQPGFCKGIMSQGADITAEECMGIMEQRRFWPTLGGTITDQWNRAFPYPGSLMTEAPTGGDDSRTGDREVLPEHIDEGGR